MKLSKTEHIFCALLVYKQYTGLDPDDDETALCDMLADLMHWADEYAVDFDRELERARGHYAAEVEEASTVIQEA